MTPRKVHAPARPGAIIEAPQRPRVTPGPAPVQPKRARLHVLGPMQLRDVEGRDCTPRSNLLQALLAVLALSPHGKRTRAKLQDLFWGESDAKQAAQSLRTTLLRLRQSLTACSLDIVEADGVSLQLRFADVSVDVLEYSDGHTGARALRRDFGRELPEILEGLNLRANGSEEFEDWLRQERQHWWERLDEILETDADAANRAPAPPPETRPDPSRLLGGAVHKAPSLGVGLLPSIVSGASPSLPYIADGFLESVATALRDVLLADVYEYRDSGSLFVRHDDGAGPQILLRVKVHEEAGRLMLTLVTYESSQTRLLWKWTVEVPLGDGYAVEVHRFVNEAVDRVSETLVTVSGTRHTGNTLYHALNVMFRFDPESLVATRDMMERAYQESGDTVHLSVLAYLNTFNVGEHWLRYDDRVRFETMDYVDTILESRPFNSLTLALTGHTCGYVLHDHDTAIQLLEQSTRLDGSLAICWDHLALNYLYAGRIEDAERASGMAIRFGGFSPFRFTYDTTMCMISTIKGDYAKAVAFGKRSLARRPNFGASLRYTAVSLAHLGEHEAARQIVAHIRSMSPDFSSDWVANDRLALVDREATSRLVIGLQKAGA